MKIIRRIFLDIKKKTGSYLLKIAVFTMLFSLFFTSILISSLATQISDNIVDQYDLTSGIQSSDFLSYYTQTREEYFSNSKKYVDVFNEIGMSEGVDNQDINFQSLLFSSLHPYNLKTESYEFLFLSAFENGLKYDPETDYYSNFGCLNSRNGMCIAPPITSVRSPNFMDLYFQRVEMVSGRSFTEEELKNGAKVCIIKHDLALLKGDTYQKMKVGDKIPVSEFYRDETGKVIDSNLHELEIIGTYIPTNGVNVNTEIGAQQPIYVPEKIFGEFFDSIIKHELNLDEKYLDKKFNDAYYIHQGIYGFNTIDHLRIFLNDLENNDDFFKNGYQYFSTVDQYYASISNVLSVSQSFDFVSKLCFIICILIAVMVLFIDVMKRRKDIGLLLSLGSSLKEILIQFIIEISLVTAVSFILALILSSQISVYGNQVLFQSSLDSMASLASFMNTMQSTHVSQEAIVELIQPQFSLENMKLFVLYIGILLGIESLTCWLLIKKIDPVELLKDE